MSVTQRAWGTYEVLHETPHSKTKVLILEPGKSISLQLHRDRDEHWVCVSGSGISMVGREQGRVYPGAYVFIGAPAQHQLTAGPDEPLVLIEVQYSMKINGCQESDIERFT